MNSAILDLGQNTEIVIPETIIKHRIICHNCSFSHEVKVIKNQILVSFDCLNCAETIVHYTYENCEQ